MLSTPSWNALLKLIEEPPPHVIFMFATTEIQKVPQTIISRVQKLMLRKITLDELIGRLEQICAAENIRADRGALDIVARRGEGSVRDALSLLDQVIAFSGKSLTAADVATVLGLSETTFFARVVTLVAAGDHAGILEALQEAADSGRDFKMLFRDLLNFIRSLLIIAGGAPETMLASSPEDLVTIRSVSDKFSYSELLRIANLLLQDDETVNRAEHQRLAVEIAVLKAAMFPRLRSVEQTLAGGGGREVAESSRGGREVAEPRGREGASPRPRDSATPRPAAQQPRDPATPRPAAEQPPAGIDALIERFQKLRPATGTYLAGAKATRREGNRITFVFTDQFYADSVNDSKKTIEEVATELFGTPITVNAEVDKPQPAAAKAPAAERAAPSPLRDDPVIQAFQKHLGGEIVEARRPK
jgi:DNA polymerase-3 subunit gamma/tau